MPHTGAEQMILDLLREGPKYTGELCRVVPCTQIQKPIQRLRKKLEKNGETIVTVKVDGRPDFLNAIVKIGDTLHVPLINPAKIESLADIGYCRRWIDIAIKA